MNSELFERLQGFRIPPSTPIPADSYVVAQMEGVDFDGIFNSPEFEFENAFDARFGKMMVRTASHLLGGDACGLFSFTELTAASVLLDRALVAERWVDVADLQNYLVGLSSARMTMLLEEEALFICRLYAFNRSDLAIGYFTWRQQEAYLQALDGYCTYVLQKDDSSREHVQSLLSGLGPREKEEILQQHNIDFTSVPAWQRNGTGVSLNAEGGVSVDSNLPRDGAYTAYLQRFFAD
jgi:tRNA(His) 5'-end guanylyltransferase